MTRAALVVVVHNDGLAISESSESHPTLHGAVQGSIGDRKNSLKLSGLGAGLVRLSALGQRVPECIR